MLVTIVVGVVCFLCFLFFNMRAVMKGKKKPDIMHRISVSVKLFSLFRNDSYDAYMYMYISLHPSISFLIFVFLIF